MSNLTSDLLKVLAKWSEGVEYEKHTWDGQELNLYIRMKKSTTSSKEGKSSG